MYLPAEKPAKILLITTYPLLSLESTSKCIDGWLRIPYFDVISLLEDSDYSCLRKLSLPRYQEPARHRFVRYLADTSCSPSLAPTLSQIIDIYSQNLHYTAFAFVNSDIFPQVDQFVSLDMPKLIDQCCHSRVSLFLHRSEVDSLQGLPPSSSLYSIGFDFFLIPRVLISSLNSNRYSDFKIGQVGWDYALPLSLPNLQTCRNSENLILHLRHPTGSSSSWGLAMLNTLALIHPSRLKALRKHQLLVFWIILKLSSLVRSKSLRTHSVAIYIFSRTAFYLFIKDMLRQIPFFSCYRLPVETTPVLDPLT